MSSLSSIENINFSLEKALIEAGKSQRSFWNQKVVVWDPQDQTYKAVSTRSLGGQERVTEAKLQQAFEGKGISLSMSEEQQALFSQGVLSCMNPGKHSERYAYSMTQELRQRSLEISHQIHIEKSCQWTQNLPSPLNLSSFDEEPYDPFNDSLANALIEAGKQNHHKGYFERKRVVVYNTTTRIYEVIAKPFFQYASHQQKVDQDSLDLAFNLKSLPNCLLSSDSEEKRTDFMRGIFSCLDRVNSLVKTIYYQKFVDLLHAPQRTI